MAEEQEIDEELSDEEKEEIESLLEDGDSENVAVKSQFQKLLTNKKLVMLICGVILLLIIGVGFFFLRGEKESENKEAEIVSSEEKEVQADTEEEIKIKKVNIYKLEPFFLPLPDNDNNNETNQFITVSASFLLSNSVLDREIIKVLPLMRKNIYNILKRKRLADFNLKQSRAEERIKKEILSASNSLLLSGTGTINDVFFSRFMIK